MGTAPAAAAAAPAGAVTAPAAAVTAHATVDTAPAAAAALKARPLRRARLWGEALAVAWLAWLYDVVTGMAPLRQALAVTHGRALLSAERGLGVAPELGLNRWLAAHHTLGVVAAYYYDNAHFVVTFGVLVWLWWRRPDSYRPLRSTLVLVNLIGLAVFWRYPVAPPRMLAQGFTDTVAASHALGSWHTGSLAADADQLAAMPSLHIAWAAWCGLALWRVSSRRWLRASAVLYPLLTAVVVMATANHYLLDVLAGLATLALAMALVRVAGPVSRRLRAR